MSRVKDKILSDASEKVRQIEEEYLLKAESMRSVYEEGCRSKAQDNDKKVGALYESEKNRLIGTRRLEMKKRILAAKRELLKDLSDSVKEQIRNDSGLYMKFIERAILKGVKTGTEEIFISQDDMNIFTDEFLRYINHLAGEITGAECSLHISGIKENRGWGLHLREGRENFNATVDVAVDSAVNDFEPELAEILFGGSN